jgi:F-type H+-transporting ATPase subunit epsilon
MKTFKLEIVATDKVFYKGDAEMLVFPGADGEHGVLADHELMVSPVVAGELRYTVDGEQKIAAVGNGFVEILGDRVILICDFVEKPQDIDIKRAQLAKERAEERIRLKNSEVEYVHSQAALSRAMARLKVTSRCKHR